jgi:hypothetical protein
VNTAVDALARIRRIAKQKNHPSGATVVDQWYLDVINVATRAGYQQFGLNVGLEMSSGWMGMGCPVWWVEEDIEEELASTPLPDGLSCEDVDWPFPIFALVFRWGMALCSFPAFNLIDADTGEYTVRFCIVHRHRDHTKHRMVIGTMNEPFHSAENSDMQNLTSNPSFHLPEQENVSLARRVIGAALLLSTHSAEELHATLAEQSRPRPPGRHQNDSTRPPWLGEAARRKAHVISRQESGGTKSPHWRRAHWRLQRVGEGRTGTRMTWVRHSHIAANKEDAE